MNNRPQPWNDPQGVITDSRRAVALMAHHLADNAAGVIHIIEDAEADDREPGLLIALLDLAVYLSPALQDKERAKVYLQRAAALMYEHEEDQ